MHLMGLVTATEKQVWSGRLHMRPIQWYLKRHWHVPEILEKVIPTQASLHPHLEWWLDGRNVLHGQHVSIDASNEGWGTHLEDSTTRGMWSDAESRLHIVEGSLPGPQELRASLQGPDCSNSNRQHSCGILHQLSMPSWRLLSWCHPRGKVLKARHIPGHLNVIAYKLSGHKQYKQNGPCLDRCSIFCAPGGTDRSCTYLRPGSITNFPGLCHRYRIRQLGSRCVKPSMGESGCLRLPSSGITFQGNYQGTGSRLSKDDSYCTGLTQHAMVLGSSQPISSGSLHTSSEAGSGNSTLQRDSSTQSQEPKPACLAPRASLIQEQGFSAEVAVRIEAPWRLSTRAVYKSK